ncbi:unnamed protein product, partial [Brenthis ino]
MLLTPGDVRDASHSCRVTRRRSARDADCQPATEESSPALRPRVATCAVTEPINVNQTNFAGNITRGFKGQNGTLTGSLIFPSIYHSFLSNQLRKY